MGLLTSLFDGRLHCAARKGDIEKAKHLLATGAGVNEQRFRRTPLLVAARNANLDMVTFLLDRGAELEARDNLGSSPLMLAAAGWDYRGEDREDRCLELVEALLNRGADPNAYGKRGQTPLRHALAAGHRRVMRLLRENGAADCWYDSLYETEGSQEGFEQGLKSA